MTCLSICIAAMAAQAPPPRDRPAPVRAATPIERGLRTEIDSGRAPEAVYSRLSKLLRDQGDSEAADAVDLQWRGKFPSSADARAAAAGVYNRRGDFENTIAELRMAADLQPQSAKARHTLAVFFWDKTRGDYKLDTATRLSYIEEGLEAEAQALAIDPDYADAMTYKNILLRLKAHADPDAPEATGWIAEADALRHRVLELQRAREAAHPRPPGPVSEPAFTGFGEPFDQTIARLTPVPVGGNVRAPTKIRDAHPRYPADAARSRIQGGVMIEVVIDASGSVANAQVVQSVPMLDGAALDAVRRWVFTPTVVNGQPVAAIMTVMVNFSLQTPQ